MKDIIEINPIYKLNSLMTNLSIYNNLVDIIKVAQVENNELQILLISLGSIKKRVDGVIKFNGILCVPF